MKDQYVTIAQTEGMVINIVEHWLNQESLNCSAAWNFTYSAANRQGNMAATRSDYLPDTKYYSAKGSDEARYVQPNYGSRRTTIPHEISPIVAN